MLFFSVFAAVSSFSEGGESLVSLESLQRKICVCVFKVTDWAEVIFAPSKHPSACFRVHPPESLDNNGAKENEEGGEEQGQQRHHFSPEGKICKQQSGL